MRTTYSSLGTALVALVFMVAILAALAAWGAGDTDLLNWKHAAAEAERIQAETAFQAQVNQMEMPYLQAEREARAQVAVAQAQAQAAGIRAQSAAEVAAQQEAQRVERARNDRRLQTEAAVADSLIYLGQFLGAALVLALTIPPAVWLTRKAWAQTPATVAPSGVASAADPWRSPTYRRAQREAARRRERQARQAQQPYAPLELRRNGH